MKDRCFNESNPGYKNYGGRGITVCDRWRDSFEAFAEDMGERPPRGSLERKDNNGNYEPGNVVWLNKSFQNNNKRSNIIVEWQGERMILKKAAILADIKYDVVIGRLRLGWSLEKALTTPVRKS